MTLGLPFGPHPYDLFALALGLPLGPQPCNPFALVASPKLGLRHNCRKVQCFGTSYNPTIRFFQSTQHFQQMVALGSNHWNENKYSCSNVATTP